MLDLTAHLYILLPRAHVMRPPILIAIDYLGLADPRCNAIRGQVLTAAEWVPDLKSPERSNIIILVLVSQINVIKILDKRTGRDKTNKSQQHFIAGPQTDLLLN